MARTSFVSAVRAGGRECGKAPARALVEGSRSGGAWEDRQRRSLRVATGTVGQKMNEGGLIHVLWGNTGRVKNT